MNINDLPKRFEAIESRLSGLDAQADAYLEIGTALADILTMLEKQGPANAKSIADALKQVHLSLDTKELSAIKPEINVTVDAPPVTVQAPEVNVTHQVTVQPADVSLQAPDVHVSSPITVNVPEAPAPIIHLMESKTKAGWKFDIEYGRSGLITSMKATQI